MIFSDPAGKNAGFITKEMTVLLIICLITGIFLSVAARSHFKAEADKKAEDANTQLIEQIDELEKTNAELEAEIKGIRSILSESQESGSKRAETLTELQDTLENSQSLAGLNDLYGPGITVSLDDRTAEAQAAYKAGSSTAPYLIHYNNLVNIINDLRIAGAEAISVNSVRIITTTDIKCAGDVILINTTRLSPPYIIKAIGDPDRMETRLLKGDYAILQQAGFPASITREEELIISAYSGSLTFAHAETIAEATDNEDETDTDNE